MPKRKCAICGQEISATDETIPYKNRHAHKACFNSYIKGLSNGKNEKLEEKKKETKTKKKETKATKPKIEQKDPLSEEDYQHKKAYYEYLRLLLDDQIPTKVYAITEKIMSKYPYDFQGMKRTLVYLHEVVEKELTGDIVGIIPFYYDDAEKFYKEVDKVEENNKNKDVNQMYSEKIIKIKPTKRVVKQLTFDD